MNAISTSPAPDRRLRTLARRAAAGVGALAVVAGALTATATSAAGAPGTDQGPDKTRQQIPAPSTAPRAPGADGPVGPSGSTTSLSVGSEERLVERSRTLDPDGTAHVRYDRTWRGLRVLGGDAVVAVRADGKVREVNWAHGRQRVVPATASSVTEAAAVAMARAAVAAAGTTISAVHAERIVWAATGMPRQAWDVLTTGVRADQVPSRRHTVVDAATAAVITSWDDVHTGVGNTKYSGQVSVTTTLSAGTYLLQDAAGNRTVDLFGGSGPGSLVTDADDVWGDGTAASRQTAAVEAQYGAQRTAAYLLSVHGRNGVWNNGQGVTSQVHYGINVANAFWSEGAMTYGDGSDGQTPFTAFDVTAHEMTHGVTEATAGLINVGESGALNESTSDILATDAEFWVANATDPGDYLIGERLRLPEFGGGPIRYLDRPSRDGRSADCWSPGLGDMDEHFGSGLFNHWFYLASEGSGAKTINGVGYSSPTCDGGAVTGIGRRAVAKIWYRALTTKLTSVSGFVAGRDGAIAAARELYGDSSAECLGVQRAFDAVFVPAGVQTCVAVLPRPGTEMLANPGFELGHTGWQGSPTVIVVDQTAPSRSPRTGSWNAWLGGYQTEAHEWIEQLVTLPAGATSIRLSYWMKSSTDEVDGQLHDQMQVVVYDGAHPNVLATSTNLTTVANYTQYSLDLTAFKGTTVTIRFEAHTDGAPAAPSQQTSWILDDVSLSYNGQDPVGSFVRAAYADFLSRPPTTTELEAAANALSDRTLSRETFLRGLAGSREWIGVIVRRMYLDTLGREPDPAGLTTWVDWIRSGRFTVAQAASLFYSSQEYFLGIGGGSNTTWVTSLYDKLLHRAPDPGGLTFWVGYAANPAYGRPWVAGQFYESLESRLTRVRTLYQMLLKRDPDPTGWPFWAGIIFVSGDLELAVGLAASPEYFLRASQRF